MKYFAKYIPDKNGNFILIKRAIGSGIFPIKRDKIIVIPNELEYLLKDFETSERFKLCLCSKDIRVGDKVRMETGEELITYYKEGCGDTLYTKGKYELEVFIDRDFKVIGEISPGATWVKEGMEFSEDDIQHVFLHGLDDIGIFEIKCPTCKTFH